MAVFLFPGQGAQFTGMGLDLYEADSDGKTGVRSLFDTASLIYGSDVCDLLTSGSDILKRTDISQLAITLVSLASVKYLASKGINPSACAGFSLGEYSALAVSGVLSEKSTIHLVIERGRVMQQAVDTMQGVAPQGAENEAPGMCAVLGLEAERIDAVLKSLSPSENGKKLEVFAANYNSPLQTVISGSHEALILAEAALKDAGARRVIRLKVAGPFHSPLMSKAGADFFNVLQDFTFKDPIVPLFSNVTAARVFTGEEARRCAVDHISKPVRWTAEESAIAFFMAEKGVSELIECGPGKVLTGLWADSKLPGICKPYTEF